MRHADASALALATLLLAPHGLAGQFEPVPTLLSFDWPVGLKAQVTQRRLQIQTADGRTDTTSGAVTYAMQVRDHPAGRLIAYDGFSVAGPDADPASIFEAGELLAALMPGIVVGRSGELVKLNGLDRLVEYSRWMLAGTLDSLPPEAEELIERFLSPEMFFAKAAEQWNAMVGLWVGADFEVGAIYEMETEEPIPVASGVTVPYLYEFVLLGWDACDEKGPFTECVVLEMRAVPDPDAVAAVMASLLGGVAGDPLVYESLEIENAVRLRTEPLGLIPHHLEITQIVRGRGSAGGEAAEFSQVRVQTFGFTYTDR